MLKLLLPRLRGRCRGNPRRRATWVRLKELASIIVLSRVKAGALSASGRTLVALECRHDRRLARWDNSRIAVSSKGGRRFSDASLVLGTVVPAQAGARRSLAGDAVRAVSGRMASAGRSRLIEGWSDSDASCRRRSQVLAIQDTQRASSSPRPRTTGAPWARSRRATATACCCTPCSPSTPTAALCLVLVAGQVWTRDGTVTTAHAKRRLADKELARWPATVDAARPVLAAAATVTVVNDREGEFFAHWCRTSGRQGPSADPADERPRRGQGRHRAPCDCRPAARRHRRCRAARAPRPRCPRKAQLEIRFGSMLLKRPRNTADRDLPAHIPVSVVEVREIVSAARRRPRPLDPAHLPHRRNPRPRLAHRRMVPPPDRPSSSSSAPSSVRDCASKTASSPPPSASARWSPSPPRPPPSSCSSSTPATADNTSPPTSPSPTTRSNSSLSSTTRIGQDRPPEKPSRPSLPCLGGMAHRNGSAAGTSTRPNPRGPLHSINRIEIFQSLLPRLELQQPPVDALAASGRCLGPRRRGHESQHDCDS